MAGLTLRQGILQATGDTNVASVMQMILNRILADSHGEMTIKDTAEALGIQPDKVRECMQTLSAKGLLEIRGTELEANTIAVFRPMRLCVIIEPVVQNDLFSSAGMTVDGTPLMLLGPVYLAGDWYRARWLDDKQTRFTVDRGNWDTVWSSIAERQCASTAAAHEAIIEIAQEFERQPVDRLIVRGKECKLELGTVDHEGEVQHTIRLMDGNTPAMDTTGATADEAMEQMLLWHKTRSEPPADVTSPKRTRKAKTTS